VGPPGGVRAGGEDALERGRLAVLPLSSSHPSQRTPKDSRLAVDGPPAGGASLEPMCGCMWVSEVCVCACGGRRPGVLRGEESGKRERAGVSHCRLGGGVGGAHSGFRLQARSTVSTRSAWGRKGDLLRHQPPGRSVPERTGGGGPGSATLFSFPTLSGFTGGRAALRYDRPDSPVYAPGAWPLCERGEKGARAKRVCRGRGGRSVLALSNEE